MRLTLRTLLAYLDNVLSSQDADALEEKIQQSEYATKLVRHVRSSIRDSRISAPALSGSGVVDVNAVAEYLDSTLPSEKIEGYEAICLPPTTDMDQPANEYMAETASCHQVLALVLGKPANVPGTLRQRIYRLDPVGGSMDTSVRAALSNDTATTTDGSPSTKKMEVPEYLREPKRVKLLPLAITLLVGFFLTFGGLRLLGPFDANHPLLGSFLTSKSTEVVSRPTAESDATTPANEANDDPATLQNDDEASDTPLSIDEAVTDTAQSEDDESDASVAEPVPSVTIDEAVNSTEINPALPTTPPATEPQVDLTTTVPMPVVDDAPPAVVTTPDLTTDSNDAGTPPATDDGPPIVGPAIPPANPDVAAATDSSPATTPTRDEPATTDGIEVGRFISADQVLVRQEGEGDAWKRVKQLSTLKSGERLRVLPGFRPQVALKSGIQMIFVKASDVVMRVSGQDGRPDLDANYMRALTVTDGTAGHKFGLKTANVDGTITFNEANTVVAIEVKRFLARGSDPESGNGLQITHFIVTDGQMTWTPNTEGATPIEVKASHALALIDDRPAITKKLAVVPTWTDPNGDIQKTDRYAVPELEPYITLDRPVSLSLMEQVTHRQRDVRSLVGRCLSHLGMHEPLVAQLNDKEQRKYWFTSIEALDAGVSRSPESAAALKEAFEKKRGDTAPDLYRLCWGYSNEQLSNGAAERLVEFLSHEEMDVRVLAWATLKEITGQTELYRPERDPKLEKSKIQQWKKNLEQGAIKYSVLPTPLPYALDSSTQ